ncbi:unnamed protein product [Prorocentrum cordatum]|uniref:MYND-type domain-containing protein n=1 Tax=Prorocentrum cordatum TaxID=2364126 RepID=A0ABN9WCH5_9DINO|nr:unnamed protein product [Polarella glacialis]
MLMLDEPRASAHCAHCAAPLLAASAARCAAGCPAAYCGEGCRQEAHWAYHEVLCPAANAEWAAFEDHARECSNEYYVLAARAFASLRHAEAAARSGPGAPWAAYAARPWWETMRRPSYGSSSGSSSAAASSPAADGEEEAASDEASDEASGCLSSAASQVREAREREGAGLLGKAALPGAASRPRGRLGKSLSGGRRPSEPSGEARSSCPFLSPLARRRPFSKKNMRHAVWALKKEPISVFLDSLTVCLMFSGGLPWEVEVWLVGKRGIVPHSGFLKVNAPATVN